MSIEDRICLGIGVGLMAYMTEMEMEMRMSICGFRRRGRRCICR